MGFLDKIEKISEKYIEGIFKKNSTSRIQPVEIARYLAREMRDKKTVSLSKVYIPNRYLILVGERDWDNLSAFASSLSQEMQEFIMKKAAEKNYSLISLPVVEFSMNNKLTNGNFRVLSKFTDDPALLEKEDSDILSDTMHVELPKSEPMESTIIAQAPKAPKAILRIESDVFVGKNINLPDKTIVIGRKEDCDIVLRDSNVSRRHAKIEIVMGSHIISDLGSTNGTIVNGNRITSKILEDGDRINLGSTALEYRVV